MKVAAAGNSVGAKTINFVMAHDEASSISRMVVMYANELAKLGFRIIVSYPTIPCPSFHHFKYRYVPSSLIDVLLVGRHLVRSRERERVWKPAQVHGMVETVTHLNYFFRPSDSNMPDADFLVVLQSYLLPYVSLLPASKGIVVDCLAGSNYERDSTLFGSFWTHLCSNLYLQYPNVKRFAVSSDVATYHRQKGIRVDCVIYNGVDHSLFFPTSVAQKEFSLLMFCDSKAAKGYDYGKRALEIIKTRYPQLKTYAVGRETSGLDLSGFDVVYGPLDEQCYAAAYRRHSIFLYPSLIDGFPAPPLEAMASGACSVLTKVPGIIDYASNGENCLLCDPGDVDQLVVALDKLLNSEGLRAKIHDGAIQTSKRFSWQASARRFVDFIESEPSQ